MVSELQMMEEAVKKLGKHTEDPYKLPNSSEQIIVDLANGGDGKFKFQTPPSSPSSIGSRRSSLSSSSMTSVNQNPQSPMHLNHNQAPLRHKSLNNQVINSFSLPKD